MARNYLKLNNGVDAAVARLSQAAGLRPDNPLTQPIALPDGSQISGVTLKKAQSQ